MRDHIRERGQRWFVRSDSQLDWSAAVVALALFGFGAAVVAFMAAHPRARHADASATAILYIVGGGMVFTALVMANAVARGPRTVVDFATGIATAKRKQLRLATVTRVTLTYWQAPPSKTHSRASAQRDSGWRVSLTGDNESLRLLDSASELRAWRTAEALAERLGVPMADDAGIEQCVREANELDLPLCEAVARLASMPAPGEPPDGLTVSSADPWRVTHPGMNTNNALVGFAAFYAVIAVVAWWTTPFLLLLPPIVGAFLVYTGLWGPRHLTVSDSEVTLEGPPFHRTQTMPLQTLEAMRISTDALHLISDRAILHYRVTGDLGMWVRTALLHHLFTRARQRDLYR